MAHHIHCLNCGNLAGGKYCSQCSQATDVGRFTWRSFIDQALHGLIHFEGTFFTTLWSMFIRPGTSLQEYLAGKRKKYQGPVTYFLISFTIQILLHKGWLKVHGFNPSLMPGVTFSDAESVRVYIEHMELLLLLCFPVTSFILYSILTRGIYSFLETVIISFYSYGTCCIIWAFSYFIGGFILGFDVMNWQYYLFTIFITMAYTFWISFDLLCLQPVKYFWLRWAIFPFINMFVAMRLLRFLSEMWLKLFQ